MILMAFGLAPSKEREQNEVNHAQQAIEKALGQNAATFTKLSPPQQDILRKSAETKSIQDFHAGRKKIYQGSVGSSFVCSL